MKRFIGTKTGRIVLSICFLLAAAGLLYASSGGETHGAEHGSLSPAKLKDLLWRVMNFAGLAAILIMALKKPIANGLRSRREAIREQFEELDARKNEAEQLYKEHESKLAQIDTEAKKIIEAAVLQAENEKQRIIEHANRAANDIKRQADMAIQHEMAEAKKGLRHEIAEEAVKLAEDILKKNLTEADQEKLVNDYLDKVGEIK